MLPRPAVLLAIGSLPVLACCAHECDTPADRTGPEHTIATFHRAMRCDRREDEYACFSERLKQQFHGIAGYSIVRAIVREQNPLALVLLDHSSLDGRVRILPSANPNEVLARVDVGGSEPFEIALVNEPEYRIRHADGKVTEGVAIGVDVDLPTTRNAEGFDIHVRDPQLFLESKRPATQIDLRERWVIDAFPGLESAIEAAKAQGTGRD